jgi:hypothetical protein
MQWINLSKNKEDILMQIQLHLKGSKAVLRTVATAVGTALLILGAAPPPVLAHHGWDEFDTSASYYMAGTLTDVQWSSPHIMVTLEVEETAVPEGLAERTLPAGLEDIGGRDVIAAARPYTDDLDELEIELAATEVQREWGLDRELQVGEYIELVGFPSHDHDDVFRADVIFLEDGTASRQRLHVLQEFPAPAGSASPSTPQERGDEAGSEAQDFSSDPAPALMWSLVGGGAVVLIVAGVVYLKRKSRRFDDD